MLKNLIGSFLVVLSYTIQANVVSPKNLAEYDTYYNGAKPLITFYSAPWCGPCKQTKPHFYAAASKHQDLAFCIIDVEAKAFSSLTTSIRSIPTIVLSYKGKEIQRRTGGMSSKDLEASIDTLHNAQLTENATDKKIKRR